MSGMKVFNSLFARFDLLAMSAVSFVLFFVLIFVFFFLAEYVVDNKTLATALQVVVVRVVLSQALYVCERERERESVCVCVCWCCVLC